MTGQRLRAMAAFIGAIALVPAATAAGEAVPVALAAAGHALMPVVVSPAAEAETRETAAELADYLGRISGAAFTVIEGDGRSGLALGRAADFPALGLAHLFKSASLEHREAYLLRTHAQGVLLLAAGNTGVTHAAWDFLHHLGHRQFFPTDNWEIIPRQPGLTIALDTFARPDFHTRLGPRRAGHTIYTERWDRWHRRNRMSSAFTLRTGHAYPGIIRQNQAAFDANPEYYALVDGERLYRGATTQFCLGNPGLRQLVVEHAVRVMQGNPEQETISMDPSDGSSWCDDDCPLCPPLGSVSSRVVLLANEVAAAINNLGLGTKYVGIYAYNQHSPPPDINVHPNVIVSIATAFIRGGFTVADLVEGWSNRTTGMLGIRDYHDVHTWNRDLPRSARGGDFSYLAGQIPFFHSRSARFMNSESADSWGANGLGYYLSGRLLWDTGIATRTEAVMADFLASAFPEATGPMDEFYHLLQVDRLPIGHSQLLARMYHALADARELTSEPAAHARLDDLVLYTRYVELYHAYRGEAGPARQAAFETLARYAWRIRDTMMVSVRPIFQDIPARDDTIFIPEEAEWPVPPPANPWKTGDPFTEAEIAAFLEQGVNNYRVSRPDFEAVTFSDDLVPARARLDLPAVPPGTFQDRFRSRNSMYTWLPPADRNLSLQVTGGLITHYRDRGNVRLTLSHLAGGQATAVAFDSSVPPDGHARPVTLASPHGGLHRLDWNDGGDSTRISWPADRHLTVRLAPEDPTALSNYWSLYFYVPRGTAVVGGYATGSRGTMRDGDDNVVLDFAALTESDYFSVPVPPGQDGRLWRFANTGGQRYLMTVPPYLARDSDELLLPREVVEADEENAVTLRQVSPLPAAAVEHPYVVSLRDYFRAEPPGQPWHADGLPPWLELVGEQLRGTPPAPGFAAFEIAYGHGAGRRSLPVNVTALAAYSPYAGYGTLLYTRDTAREDSRGLVSATGDLELLVLGEQRPRRLTRYPAPAAPAVNIISNPSFCPTGEQALYTAALNGGRFRVYLLPVKATATDPDAWVLLAENDADYRYAALSPDFDDDAPGGRRGRLAYVRRTAGRPDELWLYDFAAGEAGTGHGRRIRLETAGCGIIRHPVFTSNTTVAWLGEHHGVQNIFTSSITGGHPEQRTGNTTATVQYGRLAARPPGPWHSEPLLIYARRRHKGFSWDQWDIFSRTVPTGGPGRESRLSARGAPHDPGPCFYGRPETPGAPVSAGMMFCAVAGDDGRLHVWQVNFDTANPADSDTFRLRRTAGDADGQAAWHPRPARDPAETPRRLDDTCFFYAEGQRLARAETADGRHWTTTVFNSGLAGPEQHPATDGEGGAVLFEAPAGAGKIYRARPDLSAITPLVHAGPGAEAVGQPALSGCGRYVLYLELAGAGDESGRIRARLPDGTTVTLFDGPDARGPSFSPDLTRLVFQRTGQPDPAAAGIYLLRLDVDRTAGTIAPLGDPQRLTRRAAGTTDRQPAFSPDGRHLVFVSNRQGETALFVMDADRGEADGRRARLLFSGDVHHPAYGPVTDQPDFYSLAFVHRGEIVIGRVDRRDPQVLSGLTTTGLAPAPGAEKFAWTPRRDPGEITAHRQLQAAAPPGAEITWTISIRLDESAVPSGYTLSETFPDNWQVDPAAVLFDGQPVAAGSGASVVDNGNGTRSLRLVFGDGPALPPPHDRVRGGLVTITALTGPGDARLGGHLGFLRAGEALSVPVSGNATVYAVNPPLPVDLYDADGKPWPTGAQTSRHRYTINDFNLLRAIDAWRFDERLPGPGGAWPADTGHWNRIILAIIEIWASDRGTAGSRYPGEYTWIGPARHLDPGGDPVPEMYWTQGAW